MFKNFPPSKGIFDVAVEKTMENRSYDWYEQLASIGNGTTTNLTRHETPDYQTRLRKHHGKTLELERPRNTSDSRPNAQNSKWAAKFNSSCQLTWKYIFPLTVLGGSKLTASGCLFMPTGNTQLTTTYCAIMARYVHYSSSSSTLTEACLSDSRQVSTCYATVHPAEW